jgi:methylated-DNA-[protein]-cysteine S-methyltransferase
MDEDFVCHSLFETANGFCGIGWNAVGIVRFQLPAPTEHAAGRALRRHLPDLAPEAGPNIPPPAVMAVVTAAKRYFAGKTVDFSDVPIDLKGQSDFFQTIYQAVRKLGWGETTTYGALARALGAGPEAARDVGQAMAKNPLPLIIPCHRVLAAGGKVGGFSAPGGSNAKRRMLELEGVSLAPPAPAQQSLLF